MVNIAGLLLHLALVWAGSHDSGSSSKLLSGGTIVAWDSRTELPNIIRNGSILIVDDRISSINSDPQPSNLPNGVEIIDVSGQIVTPGFVDTHRHGWQTAFKTLASNTTLAEYFFRYGSYAAARHFRPEDVYIGQLAGLYEALNAGVTTTLDHAHHTWSNETAYAGLNASIESGARVFWAYAFHDMPTFSYSVTEQIPNFLEIASSSIFEGTNTELAIAYDSWGPKPGAHAKQVAALVKEHQVAALTTHCLAGPWGVTNLPEDVYPFGILDGSVPVIFSHGSFMTARSAQLLRKTNHYLSITPESEMHYGHTHSQSYMLQDRAALGVDTHMAYSTDILTQARIWLQSVRYHFYSTVVSEWHVPRNNPMSVVQAFTLATRSGGLALRRPDLGVIQQGAKADLVVWNARDSPPLLGWVDPIAAVMLHASVGDVLHVTVNGNFVKRDGKITAKKYNQVRKAFLDSAKHIRGIYEKLPPPVLRGDFLGHGFEYESARLVDMKKGGGNGYGEVYVKGHDRMPSNHEPSNQNIIHEDL
ncbi:amidohydrolase-like protein [Mariannaea sp. PMI_226]|nr:amidohydrolase-like protein [Mariannaea sp. PMI_226]